MTTEALNEVDRTLSFLLVEDEAVLRVVNVVRELLIFSPDSLSDDTLSRSDRFEIFVDIVHAVPSLMKS